MVEKQYIDIVGVQTFQACLHPKADMFRIQTFLVDIISHRSISLGGNDNLVPLLGNEGSKIALCYPFLIDIGTVKEVDPRLSTHVVHLF